MQTDYIEIFVPGKPATSGSKTVFRKRDGSGFIVAPANEKQKNWQAAIREEGYRQYQIVQPYTLPLDNALRLKTIFILSRPKGHFGTGRNKDKLKPSAPSYPSVKPDSLKLARAVEDALNGIIYRDDSQICKHEIEKIYTDQMNPVIGVRIFVSKLE